MNDVFRPKILAVDDQESNHRVYERCLESLNIEIVKAMSGFEALALAQRLDFSLILMDVQMSGMDGFEAADLILGHPKTSHLPIIFVTANARDEKHVFAGYETGAIDYLTKPLEPNILRAKVSVLVELYLKNREVRKQAEALAESERRLEQLVVERTAELQRSQDSLRRQYEHERITSRVLSRFVTGPFDDAVNLSLEDAGRFYEAQEAAVYRFDEDHRGLRRTHHWVERDSGSEDGGLRLVAETQGWDDSSNPLPGSVIRSGDNSPVAKQILGLLLPHAETCRLNVIPLFVDDSWSGMLVLMERYEAPSRTDDEMVLLRVLSESIGRSLQRSQSRADLQAQVRRHQAIGRLGQMALESTDEDRLLAELLEDVSDAVTADLVLALEHGRHTEPGLCLVQTDGRGVPQRLQIACDPEDVTMADALFACQTSWHLGELRGIPPLAQWLGEKDARAAIGVSVSAQKGRALALVVARQKARPFDDSEIAFVRNLTHVMDVARERLDAEHRVQASLDEKTALLQEVHHRVKNNLQIVGSLLYFQSRKVTDEQTVSLFKENENRIKSMGLIHELLYGTGDFGRIELASYVRRLGSHLVQSLRASNAPIKLTVSDEPVQVDINSAVPCGLIINELLTNAIKHAFDSSTEGASEADATSASQEGASEVSPEISPQVSVEILVDGSNVVANIRDNGVGLPPGFELERARSLGFRLVKRLIAQIEGTFTVLPGPGCQLELRFPMDNRKLASYSRV